ncbi:MAG: type III-B CRISPR-associated protein Cas10/Cmr2 [Candidatus Bathyarchaeia archaeon]
MLHASLVVGVNLKVVSRLAKAEIASDFGDSNAIVFEWVKNRLDGVSNMSQSQKVRLILGDVDAIKSFVYESDALPDIRGGSEILVELEDKVRELLRQRITCSSDLIYCGGGSFLAIVPESVAESLKQEIERLYLDEAKTTTITVVYSEPIDRSDLDRGVQTCKEQTVCKLVGKGVAEDLLFSHFDAFALKADEKDARMLRKNFGEWVSFLSSRLQITKRQKVSAPFFPALPIHERCQACGKRPASQRDEVRGELLCCVCSEKRNKGRGERRKFVSDFACWMERQGIGLANAEKRIPKDLDTLAGAEGKIAFLYADGNNMGDLLQRMKTSDDYRQLSQALSNATRESLFKALCQTFGDEQLTNPEAYLPFEIIAIGGDDVVVIVPARYGWKLALNFLEAFETHEQIQSLKQAHSQLTMSAGLVIADVKYPIRFVMNLAESLLKKAKKLARETNESTVCHLWLRAPVASEDATAILNAIYYRKKSKQERWLTARPFTLQQARRLGEIANGLKEIPTSQRRMLAEALDKGVKTSLNLALYQAAKRKEGSEKLLKAYRELGELLGCDLQDEGMFFWRRKNGIWKTALLDALELLELGAIG